MNNKNKKTLSGGESILFFFNLIWMVAVYYGCVILGEREGIMLPYQLCSGIYVSAAIILIAVSAVFSGKLVSKKTGEERTQRQKDISRKLILWALPLIIVLLIDMMDLFVVEYFKQLLSVAR